jgi:hypothetical protein
VKRDAGALVPPLLAGSLVGLAAVLTLLPILLAAGGGTPDASPRYEALETPDAVIITPPPPSVTPLSIVSPRSGDRKEFTT